MSSRSMRSICAAISVVLAVLLGATQASFGQSDSPRAGNAAQGGIVAEAKCAACHGADGNSSDPHVPKLAGQISDYLYAQLRAYRKGSRKSEIMSAIVADLSDADMATVASFYGRQSRKADVVNDAGSAAIGERLFVAGMPSCAMCHGTFGRHSMPMGHMMGRDMMGHGMMGMMGSAPRLNGQHAAYVIDQLNLFASGERSTPTMMRRIAAALSENERRAVAEYLSGLH